MRHLPIAAAFLILTHGAPAQEPAPSGSALIDHHIEQKWKEAGLIPAAPSGDAEFLRRLSLDALGTIPDPREVRAFLADARSDKRARKVEEVLARPGYGRAWAELWETLLLSYDNKRGADTGRVLYSWLRDEVFGRNMPLDQMVAALISCNGVGAEKGPVNFLLSLSRSGAGAVGMTGKATRIFMSTQIHCAQCHDHPFDRFTQEDFTAMVGFFARTKNKKVGDKNAKDSRYELYDDTKGEASTGEGRQKKTVPPAFLDGSAPAKDKPRREELARFLVRPENPLFARSMVNRVWARFFGRGIIEPVDDFSVRFKPSHPELLDLLAREFVARGHDQKWLIRAIAGSRAYQLSSSKPPNAAPEIYFSYALTRPLLPEQLCNALLQALGKGEASDTDKARTDLLRLFRTRFGDPDNVDRAEFHGTIPQALLLMNGRELNGEMVKKANRLDRILAEAPSPEERLTGIFLAALSRPPTERERAKFLPLVAAGAGRREPFEDVFWVLLNSSEFLFNH